MLLKFICFFFQIRCARAYRACRTDVQNTKEFLLSKEVRKPNPPPFCFPSVALAPTIKVSISTLLNLPDLCHKIKDGGYNNRKVHR